MLIEASFRAVHRVYEGTDRIFIRNVLNVVYMCVRDPIAITLSLKEIETFQLDVKRARLFKQVRAIYSTQVLYYTQHIFYAHTVLRTNIVSCFIVGHNIFHYELYRVFDSAVKKCLLRSYHATYR